MKAYQAIPKLILWSALVLQADPVHTITLHPEKTKQVIQGIGFEIQSDSIGTGNHGLPEERLGIPHDLVPAERERLAKEMLAGFRYCRLAGGLYWRGLDADKKFLQPRWPEQLQELKQLLDTAGVEGLSFEYWSPSPFWKSNQAYPGGTLRCFGKDFANDSEYHGDVDRFLKDFAHAVVTDVKTLQQAGLKVSMWGLQNEPSVGVAGYSCCEYKTSKDYVLAFKAVASAIRSYDRSIMIFADTEEGFPKKIAPAMNNPEIASLVDAYVVHTVGWPASSILNVHTKIRKELPLRPWFQNEYEYVVDRTTPQRCLNTVQHIMNSFQIGENPTWFWIHILKPFKNSEASGYSLGFWNSRLEPKETDLDPTAKRRWIKGPAFTHIPEMLKETEYVCANRPKDKEASGPEYSVVIDGDAELFLVGSHEPPEGFENTDLYVTYGDGLRNTIYKKICKKGTQKIPANKHKSADGYALPYSLFVRSIPSATASDFKKITVGPGLNSPVQIQSLYEKSSIIMAKMKPGSWIYNDFNWNAVGSFVKRIPWDSKVIDLSDQKINHVTTSFCYKKPNGKLTLVLSNAHATESHTFAITAELKDSNWKGFRYTPFERGESTMGVSIGTQKSPILNVTLPPMSWEFWEEQ